MNRLLLAAAAAVVGAVVGTACAAELVIAYRRLPEDAGRWTRSPLDRPDPDLGHLPPPSTVVRASLSWEADVVYATRYTIGPDGFRAAPGRPASAETVLFYGCSFVFGDGLPDGQTLPALFQAASGYRAANLGGTAYGAHHMLRLLETGRDAPAAGGPVAHGVYLGLADHVPRAVGRRLWTAPGPRYVVRDGRAVHDGALSGPLLARLLLKSGLRRMASLAARASAAAQASADADLYVAVVAGSAEAFRRRHGAGLTVVLEEEPFARAYPSVPERLRARGVRVLRLEDAFADGPPPGGLMIPHDGHPTAEYNRRLAAYLARHLDAPAKGGKT